MYIQQKLENANIAMNLLEMIVGKKVFMKEIIIIEYSKMI